MKENRSWMAVIADLFARNWITMFGASLTTASFLVILALVAVSALGMVESTAYIGIIAFLIMPAVFVFGLILIPIGAWIDRKQKARHPEEKHPPAHVLTFDLSNPRTQRAVGLVLFLTIMNVFVISAVSYQGVVYMDSTEFCGEVCHTVMEPEFTAHQNSPHGRVECVECHIGPGAPWFVRSKLSGVRQVFAVLFHTYETPIPTPVENLRPSRDICEQCHWPEQFSGDRMQVNTNFADDEENTETKTVLLMHIGGGHSETPGIHSWHINPNKNTYFLPATRDMQEIPLVRVIHENGRIVNYATPDFEGNPEAVPTEEMHLMDCIDCHNRPTHIYHMPDEALNEALEDELISPELPYIKREGMNALDLADGDDPREVELEQIEEHIRSYYAENHPEVLEEQGEAIAQAIETLGAIYQRNVFPKMDVTWGTYPNNIGHPNPFRDSKYEESMGCFRCHDDEHMSAEDDVISGSDCTICHAIPAMDEEDPEILAELGLE